ncbi:MAG: SDR family NAD(P)-dependent oxidoreductase [Chloroflexi bacterium]|nr:SDR family NAD(P)-dependent oxidoreductase [Chloroflexota bacterium]
MQLEGQVAVVTGGAEGIGRGFAVAFAEQGANVASLDIDALSNQETIRQVRATGRDGLAVDCDVADKEQVRRAMNSVVQRFGRVDVLVNNAAIWVDTALTSGTYESQARAFEDSMDICTMGTYYCSLAAVPAMQAQGGGHILNVITEHVHEGHLITGLAAATGYDAAKFAQARLTETWAVELKPHNIRVNALCMGATDSPMFRATHDSPAEVMPADIAQGALNILAHGPDGPTGELYLFAASGTSREQSLREIAALAPGS